MNFLFNKIYHKTDGDGLLELYFFNFQEESLYFNGGGFTFKKEAINPALYLEYKLNSNRNSVSDLKENEEMDFILSINQDVLMKIFFFPNDNYPNGVAQVFRIYNPESAYYSGLLRELRDSEDIF